MSTRSVTLRAIAVLSALLASCESGPHVLTDTRFADSTRVAPNLDSTTLARGIPPHVVLALPDSVHEFDMAVPVGIGFQPDGPCLLAVVDRGETAVHYFAPSGVYRGTLFLGGRGSHALSGIDQIGIGSDGTSYVWELGRQRIVAIDPSRKHFRVFRPDSVTADPPPLAAIQPLESNRLLDNWMTPSLSWASRNWAEERLPLLRIIDTLGHDHGGLWRVADAPGDLLTHALNQGRLAMRGDTIWFAYVASGQILRGTLDGSADPWTIRDTSRIVLPRMYRPAPPRWFRAGAEDTIGSVSVEEQLQGLGVTEGGRLIVAQTISYPRPGDRTQLHVPSSALVIYDSSGSFLSGWRAGGRVRDFAVGRGYAAIILDPTSGGAPEVRVFRLADLIPGDVSPERCSEEN